MFISDKWTDYELIDCSDGNRLERWGKYTLIRPDPQVIWKDCKRSPLWKEANAFYSRSKSGGGHWEGKESLPEGWEIGYESLGLRFKIKPMGFKHTGLFPEQAANWEWFSELIKRSDRPIRVLNLFAYTGGATIAAAAAGAQVTHVDAAKGMVAHARENASLSGLSDAPIRWIVDDCRKFVEREIKRGKKYDAIIMDPPSYGRGPTGEVWKLEDNIYDFVKLCSNVISDEPLFVLINSYTTGLSASTMGYVIEKTIGKDHKGNLCCREIGLPVKEGSLVLPCGGAARWVSC